jgi:hypothetical protein
MNKKIITFVIICFFGFFTVAYAEEIQDEVEELLFPDLVVDSFYIDSVTNMANLGVIKGYEDGTFGPDNPITRAEMAVMLDRYDRIIGESSCSQEVELLRDELDRMKELYKTYEENPATSPPEA